MPLKLHWICIFRLYKTHKVRLLVCTKTLNHSHAHQYYRFHLFFCILILVNGVLSKQCACSTGSLNVRNGPGISYTILGTFIAGECNPDKGGRQIAGGLDWANINFNGQNAWAATRWLNFKACLNQCACSTTGSLNVRTLPGTSNSVVGTMSNGECHSDKSGRHITGGYTWENIDYNGQSAWTADKWLQFKPCPNQCACSTTNLNVRTGAGTIYNILGTMSNGECHPDKGERQTVGSNEWANINYNGKNAWAAEKYLQFKPCSGTSGCPNIVSRAEWGARPPKSALSQLPNTPKYVFIHHGASGSCYTRSNCIAKVKAYQNYHMNSNGWSDIGYSFVVGEDGNVYEARGWDYIGAHTSGHNSVGIGICVIGDFTSRVPNDAAIIAVKNLIKCGVDTGKLTSNYILQGHRDVKQTTCPGQKFYDLIRTWSHYSA